MGTAEAAPPQLTTVIPRGWKAGANEVTLQGTNLTETTRLVLDVPGASVAPKPESKPAPNQLQFVVTLPADMPPGVYQARVAGEEGISNAAVWMVDQLPNVVEVEPNNDAMTSQVLTLPAAVEGRLGGVESDVFAFEGKAGQKIVAEIAGRRLGCNIKPILRLLNASQLELALARPARTLGSDTRLVFTLPADGRYFIELHDLVYRGDNNQYRLLIGELQVADHIFPLGTAQAGNVAVQMLGGTLAAPVPITTAATPRGSELAALTLPAGLAASPLPLSIAVREQPGIPEQPQPEGKPQPLTFPAIIDGQLAQPGELDRYRVEAAPGTKLKISVLAERLGVPLDAVIELRADDNRLLVTQDDGPGTADPDFLYTVPEGVTAMTIGLTDVQRRGGPACAYRLEVEPAPIGDFSLSLLNPLVNIPAGGQAAVRVRATRRDFNDPIRLRLIGAVPPGLKLVGAEILAGATDTYLSLQAPADAPLAAGSIQILGEAGAVEKPTLIREALLATDPVYEGFPWLRTRFAGAVTKPALLSVEVEPNEPLVLRGMPYELKVKVKRTEGQTGPITLNVLTSQVPLPGQVPVNGTPNQQIPENMLEGLIKFNIPPNATDMPLTYIVTAQLLDAKNKQTPVALVESTSLITAVAMPFAVELGPLPVFQRGVRSVIPAKLTRRGSFKQPVQIALTGLPGISRTATLTLAPETTNFSIPILVHPAQAPGAIPNVKVTGTWASTPPLAITPLDLPLTVIPDDVPAALEIFDEGPDFGDALTEGTGMVKLETADAFSGKESVLVTGVQKERVVLPGLGVIIADVPTPGQYRYLRFAWKKKGGTTASLHLGRSNLFRQASPKGTDFGYVAGADSSGGKSIKLGEAVPAEWTVVTRDLYADHGPFNLSGISLTSADGEGLLVDHIYLARTEADFPAPKAK